MSKYNLLVDIRNLFCVSNNYLRRELLFLPNKEKTHLHLFVWWSILITKKSIVVSLPLKDRLMMSRTSFIILVLRNCLRRACIRRSQKENSFISRFCNTFHWYSAPIGNSVMVHRFSNTKKIIQILVSAYK